MVRGLGRAPLGTMPLGGGVYSLASIIKQSSMDVFRRVEIKRREVATGLFESSWQDISQYIKSFGTIERSLDDVRLNRFRNSGFNFKVRNDTGKFNDEDNANSLWNGHLTRYRSLVRVQAGYLDGTTELPTDPTLGIFIMDQELPQDADSNDLAISASSLQSIFEEVRSFDIAGINTTLTASEIIAKIRDHTDGAGAFVFRQFITSTAWLISSTTAYYNMTTTTLQEDNLTAWELMVQLAESEQFVCDITRTGGVEFRNRDPRTTTSAFDFRGQGFASPSIITLRGYKEALDKHYTFFDFKWQKDDTTTSHVYAGTQTTITPLNLAWKYGSKTYQFENNLITNTTTAQAIVNATLAEFGTPGRECEINSKFIPDLELLDRVTVSYHSYDLAGISLWDVLLWDDGNWATEGENFDWDSKGFKVLKIKHSLDKFITTSQIRQLALGE
jgi:hypothetical protein